MSVFTEQYLKCLTAQYFFMHKMSFKAFCIVFHILWVGFEVPVILPVSYGKLW